MSYLLKVLFCKKQYTEKTDRNRQERLDAGNSLCESVSLHHHQSKLFQRQFQNLRARFCQEMNAPVLLQQRPQHMLTLITQVNQLKWTPPYILKIEHVFKCQLEARAFSILTHRKDCYKSGLYTQISIDTATPRPEGLFFPDCTSVNQGQLS